MLEFHTRYLLIKTGLISAAFAWWLYLCVSSLIRLELHTAFHSSAGVERVRHYNLVRWFTFDSHFYHFDEGLVNLHAVLGRCLKVLHVVVFLAPAFSFLGTDLSLWFAVYLVAYQHERETLGIVGSGILNKAILPFIKSLEARRVCQIKTECTTISSSVECKT